MNIELWHPNEIQYYGVTHIYLRHTEIFDMFQNVGHEATFLKQFTQSSNTKRIIKRISNVYLINSGFKRRIKNWKLQEHSRSAMWLNQFKF